MPIPVKCPACGKQYNVKETMAGKKVQCKCGEKIPVVAGKANAKPTASNSAAAQSAKAGTAASKPAAEKAAASGAASTMVVGCGDCGKKFNVKKEMAGKKVRCKCGSTIVVPGGGGETAAKPAAPKPPASRPAPKRELSPDDGVLSGGAFDDKDMSSASQIRPLPTPDPTYEAPQSSTKDIPMTEELPAEATEMIKDASGKDVPRPPRKKRKVKKASKVPLLLTIVSIAILGGVGGMFYTNSQPKGLPASEGGGAGIAELHPDDFMWMLVDAGGKVAQLQKPLKLDVIQVGEFVDLNREYGEALAAKIAELNSDMSGTEITDADLEKMWQEYVADWGGKVKGILNDENIANWGSLIASGNHKRYKEGGPGNPIAAGYIRPINVHAEPQWAVQPDPTGSPFQVTNPAAFRLPTVHGMLMPTSPSPMVMLVRKPTSAASQFSQEVPTSQVVTMNMATMKPLAAPIQSAEIGNNDLWRMSPDGRHVARFVSFGEGIGIQVYSLATGERVQILDTGGSRCNYFDFTDSNHIVGTFARSRDAKLWDITTGQVARDISLIPFVTSTDYAAVSPGGRYLAVLGVYQMEEEKKPASDSQATPEPPATPEPVASGTGPASATGEAAPAAPTGGLGGFGGLSLSDLNKVEEVKAQQPKEEVVDTRPKDPYVVRLHIHDLTTGEQVGNVTSGKDYGKGMPESVVFSDDGAELAVMFRFKQVGEPVSYRIVSWNLESGAVASDIGPFKSSQFQKFAQGDRKIEWLPGRSGWLLSGMYMINRQNGQVQRQVGDPLRAGSRLASRLAGGNAVVTFWSTTAEGSTVAEVNAQILPLSGQ